MFFKKNILNKYIYIVAFFILVIIISFIYKKYNDKSNKYNELRNLATEHLVDALRVYDVYDENNKKLKFLRHGRKGDGGYVVPEITLSEANVVLGYGISDDISFEEEFSNLYNKPSYGFDCGIEVIEIKNRLCKFIRECISSDKFLYKNQNSSNMVSSFSKQLKKLNLENQKIFVKMDIEGAEYEAFKDIYKHSANITGIALEIHFDYFHQILKATHLITRLNHDFYLVHVHPNNCCDHKRYIFKANNAIGRIPNVLELTFINKSLVHRANISLDQSHPQPIDMLNCPELDDIRFEIKSY